MQSLVQADCPKTVTQNPRYPEHKIQILEIEEIHDIKSGLIDYLLTLCYQVHYNTEVVYCRSFSRSHFSKLCKPYY